MVVTGGGQEWRQWRGMLARLRRRRRTGTEAITQAIYFIEHTRPSSVASKRRVLSLAEKNIWLISCLEHIMISHVIAASRTA